MKSHIDLLIEGISDYIENLLPEREQVFYEMEKIAEKKDFPNIGPVVGSYLVFFTRLINAQNILELGSGFGYSASWFAKAMNGKVNIVCTDFEKDNERKAKEFVKKLGYSPDILNYYIGDAFKSLEEIEGKFDLIFNDIDKEEYPLVVEKSLPKLRKSGLLISDNTLWYGKVTEEEVDAATKGVIKYNQLVFNHPKLISIILPIRDGITISFKVKD